LFVGICCIAASSLLTTKSLPKSCSKILCLTGRCYCLRRIIAPLIFAMALMHRACLAAHKVRTHPPSGKSDNSINGGISMSHIVTIETEIRDAQALCSACHRLGLSQPVQEQTRLFTGEASGYCVRLPDWRYPVVCDVDSGQIRFDNFEGRWGEQRELDRLLQAYAAEKAKLEARRQGYVVTEQQLECGSIKLTIHVGEAT
jgi:hypothetical protein